MTLRDSSLEKEVRNLKQHTEDLENRNRRNNLRIYGLPESLEGDDPVSSFTTFLPKLLDMPSTTSLSIQRAHRLGPRPSLSTSPVRQRGVIILFLKFTDLLSVLSAPRAKRQISWLGQKVFLSQDVSNATAARRKEFLNLREKNKGRAREC